MPKSYVQYYDLMWYLITYSSSSFLGVYFAVFFCGHDRFSSFWIYKRTFVFVIANTVIEMLLSLLEQAGILAVILKQKLQVEQLNNVWSYTYTAHQVK